MKKLLLLIVCFICICSFAQQKITIHGKVDLLSKSKNIEITGLPKMPINADGIFELTGEIKAPGIALILTDSSGASAIWLEAGDYTLECKEIRLAGIQSVLMRTSKLAGPLDAMIYNDYCMASYKGFLYEKPTNEPQKTATDEEKAAKRKIQQKRVVQYVDSIIDKYPDSKVLPDIIRDSKYYTGDEGTKALIAKLSKRQQATEQIKQLLTGLKRNEAIAKDGGFENFSMKTADGKEFKLSDIKNKKLILIDFWASDCGPCRITHPQLIALYQKYADKGLEIVSVSLDNDHEKWLNAIKEDKIGHWINVSDLKNWGSPLVKKYAVSFIPFRFLLNGNYKVLSHDDDGQIWVTPGTIEQEIKKMGW